MIKMRDLILLALLASGGLAGTFSTASGQVASPDGSGPQTRRLTPGASATLVSRYVATYMSSQTAFESSPRSLTAVSITNNSSSTCDTSVDWKIGFEGIACTTTLTLGPGETGEHCSRDIRFAITSCNATCSPELTFAEGNAIIGSTKSRSCEAIAVSARTYYTTGTSDETLNAITDAKIVRVGAGNHGD